MFNPELLEDELTELSYIQAAKIAVRARIESKIFSSVVKMLLKQG